ncbi:MAG: IPT/TIG domain-containing protein [Deltaproteobacteria bacterium]|nr:IPT/TIG domain-containing protein [Deltaproteobacteria bacterium]
MRRCLAPALPLGAALLVGSCIATAPEGIHRVTDQDAGTGDINLQDAAPPDPSGETPQGDPHAVVGVDPPNGPFSGGQRVIVHGAGFKESARVWFGESEAQSVVPIDPTRVQAQTPPGKPGPVDVWAQNGDDASTRRALPAGYTYEALYAEPPSGPVAGGTVVTIHGAETSWDESTVARIDQKPCTTLAVLSPTELSCTVPKGTPGAKAITTSTGKVVLTALDGYTYEDSSNGFKGGLSGKPLAGTLKVLVFDNYSGDPIPGALAIAGSNLQGALTQPVDATGMALFQDASLDEPVTVTALAKCHSPISFVHVPVDTVTVYLDPALTPQCAGDGDPPPVGGKGSDTGTVTGELVWKGGVEFQRSPWTNVPAEIGPNEKRVAYVFEATDKPGKAFELPSESQAVYPSSPGSFGYAFALAAQPGNRALYAVAGIRDDAYGLFTGYAFGAVKGVGVFPNETTDFVYISMTPALDQVVKLDVKPPAVGPKGPDRVRVAVALELAKGQYAVLPGAQKEPLIPLFGLLTIAGVPPLDGDLAGVRYVSSARAVTGPSGTPPLSVIAPVATISAAVPVDLSGFVAIPTLLAPTPGGPWDGRHLAVQYKGIGWPVDLIVYEIISGGGLIRWLVAVPGAESAAEVPNLVGFAADSAAPGSGAIEIGVYGARIDGLDYGKLTYKNLRPAGMTAYSLDYFKAHL